MDSPVPWLVATPRNGSLAPGGTTQVVVEIDQVLAAELPAGTYPSDLLLRSLSNVAGDIFMPFQLTVGQPNAGAIHVMPEDELTINASSFSRSAILQGTIHLSNVGTAPVNWQIRSEATWLTVETPNEDAIDVGDSLEVTVNIDAVLLASEGPGPFETPIHIEVPNDPEASQDLMVVVQLMSDEGRVRQNLIAEYLFDEGAGSVVQDRSGVTPALDLNIENTQAVTWLPGGLAISSPTLLSTSGPASRVSESVSASGEITVEAWLRPANLNQEGPARLFGISNGPSLRNFTLGQGLWGGQPKDTFNMRLRTSSTDMDGMPLLTTDAGSATTGLQHLVYTHFADGTSKLFINGQLSSENLLAGHMNNWDTSYRMAVAGEIGTSRPWLGELYLLAIYDRALTETEIERNRAAGSGAEEVGQLSVTPNAEIQVTATLGQGLYVNVDEFSVENLGGATLDWTAQVNQPWLSLGSSQGTLS
ncbi:MAG: LamG domain-containing protein, partial [Planctomycetes bacterium]|nr:LamG domain-containing protein [Planctomycetota bacterium]